jgi:hypothetical protein
LPSTAELSLMVIISPFLLLLLPLPLSLPLPLP